MIEATAKSPRVLIPPPILFALAFILGLVLQHFLPIAVAPTPARQYVRLAGILLVVSSAVLAAAAFITLARHRTTFRTDRAVSALVTSGPFRFTRNPMYLSLTLLLAGASALLDSFWLLAFLLPVLLLVQRIAIVPEERYLLHAYGSDYDAYCRRVRRWL